MPKFNPKNRPSFHGRKKSVLSTATRLAAAAMLTTGLHTANVDPQTNALITLAVIVADPVARMRRLLAVQRMKASLEGYPENPPIKDRFGRPVTD